MTDKEKDKLKALKIELKRAYEQIASMRTALDEIHSTAYIARDYHGWDDPHTCYRAHTDED